MRARVVLGAAATLLAMTVFGVPGAAAMGPLFEPPMLIDSGVDGTWMPGYPVRNLDGARGLDLAVLGCKNNQNAMPPAPPNVVSCPAPEATLSILLGDGAGRLRVAQQLNAGTYPTDVTSGQFNNDQRLDLAVTDPFGIQATGRGEVLIYQQQATPVGGELFRLQKVVTLAGPQPKGVQSADVNRDGAQDLVVLMNDPNGPDVQVLLGDKSGNFSFQPQPAFGDCPTGHFFKGFADFNKDGKLDFAAPCTGGGKVAVMLGNGDGTFAEQYIPVPGSA